MVLGNLVKWELSVINNSGVLVKHLIFGTVTLKLKNSALYSDSLNIDDLLPLLGQVDS